MIPGIVAVSGLFTAPPDAGGIPEDAIYYTSFKDGVYWNGADTTLGAMWVSDAAWGTWDSATVIPGTGLQNTGADDPFAADPSLASSLIAALSASGTTIVLGFVLEADGNARFDLFKDDYSVEFFATAAAGGSSFFQAGGTFADSSLSLTAGTHKLAATVTTTKIVISIDGETAVPATHSNTLADVTSFGLGITHGVLDTVLFLPPRADADLPALSAVDAGPPPVTAEAGSVVLYTGNETARSITGVGLQPDLIFLRDRSGDPWRWVDTERGLTSWMNTATFTGEDFDTDGITAVGADGFDLGESTRFNADGIAYAAFCLKQIAGGFDIITYTGGGGDAIPHSLGVVPELIIVADRYDNKNWLTYAAHLGSSKYLFVNDTAGEGTTTAWASSTPPDDSNIYITNGIGNGNKAGDEYVAYLFASLAGKIKVGSYTGTGASGNAIATGFRPKWVLIKATSTTGDWLIADELRDTTDPITASMSLNTTAVESTSDVSVTFSDTGFEPTTPNASGATYLYLAVA